MFGKMICAMSERKYFFSTDVFPKQSHGMLIIGRQFHYHHLDLVLQMFFVDGSKWQECLKYAG